jgi:hypothetical protein
VSESVFMPLNGTTRRSPDKMEVMSLAPTDMAI